MSRKTRSIEWAAGLFEGEGCIKSQRSYNKRYAILNVTSTDRDVLAAFRRAVGMGKVHGPYETGHKPYYRWHLGRRADVCELLRLFRPYLLSRRLRRMREVLRETL